MKTENFVTWLLLGYIAWKLHEGLQVGAGPACGGVTTTPGGTNLANVIQAGWMGEAASGGLGCYQCGVNEGMGCVCG